MTSTFHAPAASSSSSHYSRYNDDALDTDEEEEERRLSEQYGEAADDDGASSNQQRKRGRKQQANNTTLTEEDAAAAKEFEEKVRSKAKKARPSLQPAQLKSAKGLVYVRRAFPTLVKKYKSGTTTTSNAAASLDAFTATTSTSLAHKLNTQSQINASARYSRSLMSAYRDFAHELFPSFAAEDVFLKIEDLGSKKEVKDYLQLMRDEFRKEYLEQIYGVEKAGRLLNELEHGLKVHSMNPMEEEGEENYPGGGGGGGGRGEQYGTVAPRLGHAVTNEDGGGGGGEEEDDIVPPATSAIPMASNPYAGSSTNPHVATTTSSEVADATNVNAVLALNDSKDMVTKCGKGDDDEDDGEEEEEEAEATFEENDGGVNVESTEVLVSEICNDIDVDAAAAGEEISEERNDIDLDMVKDSETRTFEMDEKNADADGTTMTVGEAGFHDQVNGNNYSDVDNDKTQETLTLLESQFDDDDVDDDAELGATQDDERFSQRGVDMGCCDNEDRSDNKMVVGDDMTTYETVAVLEVSTNDEEENTADERFSQFTQGLIFEQDEGAEDEEGTEVEHGNCDQLGQPTQLSMEY